MIQEQKRFVRILTKRVNDLVAKQGHHINGYKLEIAEEGIKDNKNNQLAIVPYWLATIEKLFDTIKHNTKRTAITWRVLQNYLNETVELIGA